MKHTFSSLHNKCVCMIPDQTGAFKSVTNLTGRSYFYSFAVYNNSVYYSDWADKSIYIFDLVNQTKRTLVGNLTRPTRFLIERSTKTVPSKIIKQFCLFFFLNLQMN